MNLLYGAPVGKYESGKELEQCDWLRPILNDRKQLCGIVRCPREKSFELWDEKVAPFNNLFEVFSNLLEWRETPKPSLIFIGVYCPFHFFEMMRLREEKRSVRFNQWN